VTPVTPRDLLTPARHRGGLRLRRLPRHHGHRHPRPQVSWWQRSGTPAGFGVR